ncbi:hypothetical protein CLOLEP_02477 [[Clostridium] leptum DSM 753]|uniref:Uncharacterized protein n=1 Tax=[Clostridium] leptum DSM 753 TaxID=428125 RepID=A7VV72_9FIRM|nr:hypothetical protein CLOLEP_02477 [[Clostridium] leptum DSM 753]
MAFFCQNQIAFREFMVIDYPCKDRLSTAASLEAGRSQ